MFSELNITSNFTFLTGGSHAEDYIRRAALIGIPAIAIADENSVAGIVRAHTEAREVARQVSLRKAFDADHGFIGPPVPDGLERPLSADIYTAVRLIPAARIVLVDGFSVTVLPQDRKGWGNLCRMISKGRLRAQKGSCQLRLDDLIEWGGGQQFLLHPQMQTLQRGADNWLGQAQRLTRRFPEQVALLMAPKYDGQDPTRFDRLASLAETLAIPTVASGAPIMHHASRRKLTDVLTAIRTGTRVDQLGRAALINAERRMRSQSEMLRLFSGHQEAVHRSGDIAARLTFSLDELRYEYPSEIFGDETPAERLSRLAHAGLNWRYPNGASDKVRKMLAHELALIGKLKYEPYFL
ncbi:MAG: PHP domain-containing protein, partial [Marinosulfonomonas sp.]|nr:PHP domain-containing protein [Marinosulfonomonas sp.]